MDWIQPMEPVSRDNVVQGREWFHEIKWDGIRGMMYVQGGSLKIFTKSGNERTCFYPELLDLPRLLRAKEVIIDGEVIVLDERGKPSFYLSLIRERVRDRNRTGYYSARYPAKYVAFDILYKNGVSLVKLPVEERKEILRKTLESSPVVAITDQFDDGAALFDLMKEKGWEGIVSKKYGSAYIGGKRHKLWYKTKFFKKMLTVIGGIQWKDGIPNSLLLGVFKANDLVFVGKASIGLTQQHLYLLKQNYDKLEVKKCPFSPESISGIRGDISWLSPVLTCWTTFLEFTGDGQMRHPRITGFALNKPEEANGTETACDLHGQ